MNRGRSYNEDAHSTVGPIDEAVDVEEVEGKRRKKGHGDDNDPVAVWTQIT